MLHIRQSPGPVSCPGHLQVIFECPEAGFAQPQSSPGVLHPRGSLGAGLGVPALWGAPGQAHLHPTGHRHGLGCSWSREGSLGWVRDVGELNPGHIPCIPPELPLGADGCCRNWGPCGDKPDPDPTSRQEGAFGKVSAGNASKAERSCSIPNFPPLPSRVSRDQMDHSPIPQILLGRGR